MTKNGPCAIHNVHMENRDIFTDLQLLCSQVPIITITCHAIILVTTLFTGTSLDVFSGQLYVL